MRQAARNICFYIYYEKFFYPYNIHGLGLTLSLKGARYKYIFTPNRSLFVVNARNTDKITT